MRSKLVYLLLVCSEFIWATLEGANPVLAPGILTLGAVIGLAATYRHQVLETK